MVTTNYIPLLNANAPIFKRRTREQYLRHFIFLLDWIESNSKVSLQVFHNHSQLFRRNHFLRPLKCHASNILLISAFQQPLFWFSNSFPIQPSPLYHVPGIK